MHRNMVENGPVLWVINAIVVIITCNSSFTPGMYSGVQIIMITFFA